MRRHFRAVLAAMLVGVLGASASAQLIYSAGFESPTFVLGSINGQDGWVNGSGSGVSQTVSTALPFAGTQSLFWDNTGASNSFYSVRRSFNGQAGAIAAATPLEISSWLFLDRSSEVNRLLGVYATNSGTGTLGSTALGITISGNGDIRAGTTWTATYSGPVLYNNPAIVGNWVQVVLRYNGVGGSAALYDLGANQLWSTTFASVSLANSNLGGTNSWNINLGTDYVTTTLRAGKGFHDDLVVRVVPEPTSLLALAALGLIARRRR